MCKLSTLLNHKPCLQEGFCSGKSVPLACVIWVLQGLGIAHGVAHPHDHGQRCCLSWVSVLSPEKELCQCPAEVKVLSTLSPQSLPKSMVKPGFRAGSIRIPLGSSGLFPSCLTARAVRASNSSYVHSFNCCQLFWLMGSDGWEVIN